MVAVVKVLKQVLVMVAAAAAAVGKVILCGRVARGRAHLRSYNPPPDLVWERQ